MQNLKFVDNKIALTLSFQDQPTSINNEENNEVQMHVGTKNNNLIFSINEVLVNYLLE